MNNVTVMPPLSKEEYLSALKSARSVEEWNDICDRLKEQYGDYPDWWFPDVIVAGLAPRLTGR